MTRFIDNPRWQLAIILAFSLAYRVSTFGHPNIHDDETLYFLIGQEMHRGALPYVDVWDRKPFGLFALYYLIAGVSHSVLAYQIAAWISAALTGWVIALIGAEITNRRGGLLAGLSYIAALPMFLGWGGQAPVFYNLPIAAAGLLICRALPNLRTGKTDWTIDLAMLLGGIAVTMKQSAIVEAVFFGLFCAAMLARSPLASRKTILAATRWALIGAMPTLLISGFYFLVGHWQEYWFAMVLSNLAKHQVSAITLLDRTIRTYLLVFPLLCSALIGLGLSRRDLKRSGHGGFVYGWMVAAWLGFLIVPNIYPHYILPVLVPICLASGLLFARRDLGLIFFLLLSLTSLMRYRFWDFGLTGQAQRGMASMAEAIKQHDGGRGLFIHDGPLLLYPMTGHRPMTPLLFPPHLNYAIEENVSHINTAAEVARVLAERPGAVLVSHMPRNNPYNATTRKMVKAYIHANCRLIEGQWTADLFRSDAILVYGDCTRGRR